MKNYTLLIIVCVFSFSGFAQKSKNVPTNNKTEKILPTSNNLSNDELAVVAYYVEETINMKFGGRKTTYTVTDINLVDTNELGPENTRVVTPKYTKIKLKEELPFIKKLSANPVVIKTNFIKPTKVDLAILPKRKLDYITIHILENYERVLDKGYITEDMLKAVANYRYFDSDLEIAAKWYSQLFDICPEELDATYFYRYAQSLDCIGQIEKAKAMMSKFETKKR